MINTQTITWNVQGPSAQVQRLQMIRGNSQNIYIQVQTATGTPYNLTGATVWFIVKKRISDPDSNPAIYKITPSGISIVDAAGGLIKLQISVADTINFPPWNCLYFYTLQIQDDNNLLVQSPLIGTIDVYNDVYTSRQIPYTIYYGTSSLQTLASLDITGLGTSVTTSNFANNYVFNAGDYKYFCGPDTFIFPSKFTDANTNLQVDMATNFDNISYINQQNGLYYAIVNVNGINYRVYRTKNILGSGITITVS